MKKLKIFTNHFFPENFKINDLSKEFSKVFEVDVITQVPNYSKPSYYDGYGIFKNNKMKFENVTVKRIPVIPRKNSRFMLLINYISYIISSFIYSFFTKDKADHVLVYVTSPIFISWAGLRFARKNKIESTLYLLDLWPDSLISVLDIKNKFVKDSLVKTCVKIYSQFDNIFVSSYGFIEALVDYGINESKIYYVPQHANNSKHNKRFQDEKIDVLKIVFTGNIGEAQGLEVLIETAKKLKELNFKKVHFLIVGDGSYKSTMIREISDLSLDEYFTFQKYVDPKEIPGILSENHFGFVSLKDRDVFNRTLPAKVQSYMSFGIPILGSASGEIPHLVNHAKCGFVAPAGDASSLVELIIKAQTLDSSCLEELSENGYNYSKIYFDINKIVDRFVEVMKE